MRPPTWARLHWPVGPPGAFRRARGPSPCVVGSEGSTVKELVSLLPYVAILAIFWLLLIRPQQRRNRELRTMQQSLSVGDEILLTSGVFAVVREIADDHVRVEIADDVVIKVARGAVGAIVRPDSPHDTQPDTAPDSPVGPEEN